MEIEKGAGCRPRRPSPCIPLPREGKQKRLPQGNRKAGGRLPSHCSNVCVVAASYACGSVTSVISIVLFVSLVILIESFLPVEVVTVNVLFASSYSHSVTA